MSETLRVERVEKYYGNKNNITKALNNISFGVDKGEFIGVMGASGSGKTTLLNCISTIDQVTGGNIFIDNTDISEIKEDGIAKFRRDNLGFVFQDFNLLDTLTIEENIGLTLTLHGMSPDEISRRIKNVSEALGITDILSKFPSQVSGGQKQRCACARAIINEPKLLLADEPTGALDSKSAGMLLEIMSSLNENMKTTILMVTHDPFSASYAGRILFLKDGKIFNEIRKGEKTRQQFYHETLEVLALLGGDVRC